MVERALLVAASTFIFSFLILGFKNMVANLTEENQRKSGKISELEKQVRDAYSKIHLLELELKEKTARESSRKRLDYWQIERFVREYARNSSELEKTVKRRMRRVLRDANNIIEVKDISAIAIKDLSVEYFIAEQIGKFPEPEKKKEYLTAVIDNGIYQDIIKTGLLAENITKGIEKKQITFEKGL